MSAMILSTRQAIGQRQSLSQKQAMAPQMRLALSLLSLPISELREAVKKEAETNVAIEEVELSPTYITDRSVIATMSGADENRIAANDAESLEEHLFKELSMSSIPEDAEVLCQTIIENLNPLGWFTGSIPDLVMITGASRRKIEEARQFVMHLDPKGAGAKNFEEAYSCHMDEVPEALRAQFKEVIKALKPDAPPPKISPELVKVMSKIEAFPGRLFSKAKPDFIVADISVDANMNIEVETKDIPEIRISPKYLQMAKDKSCPEDARLKAIECVERAKRLQEALVRRQDTLVKIASLAISRQAEAVKHGLVEMKQLKMTEIAKLAGCHVTTVSRAANRKYVRTPKGTWSFRSFFQRGEKTNVKALRALIEELLPLGPLPTDKRLSEILAERGYKMARRTVAKYRAKII